MIPPDGGTPQWEESAMSMAQRWLARQQADNAEPLLDAGDCRCCGAPSGEGHEPTDPCGIIANLVAAVTALTVDRDALLAEVEPLRARNLDVWSNPEAWMKWCDHQVLERADAADAACDALRVDLDQERTLNGHAALSAQIAELEAARDALRGALRSALDVANVAFEAWDADRDSRVGKLLCALSGHLKGYRADIDAIYAVLKSAAEAPARREAQLPTDGPFVAHHVVPTYPRTED